jgi:peptidoglycan hydrolase CwlO-like protein
MSEREPDLDAEVEDLEKAAEKVQDDIDETESDWESKKEDPSVPGAVPEEDEGG